MVESGGNRDVHGEYQHNLDTKGRIIIPAKFRDELGDTMSNALVRWMSSYLHYEQWQALYEKLQTYQPLSERREDLHI